MSFCSRCGKEIPENARYCPNCGRGDRREVAEQRTSGMAVASLVTGIIGIFLIPIIFSLLAIIFGSVGINQASRPGIKSHGMAVAGLVLGIIGLVGDIIFLVIWFTIY